jgi:hypothetical protein
LSDPIAKLIGRTPTDETHLRAMRAAAYHKQGIIVFRPEEIRNEIDREYVIQVAEKIYGKRQAHPP